MRFKSNYAKYQLDMNSSEELLGFISSEAKFFIKAIN